MVKIKNALRFEVHFLRLSICENQVFVRILKLIFLEKIKKIMLKNKKQE